MCGRVVGGAAQVAGVARFFLLAARLALLGFGDLLELVLPALLGLGELGDAGLVLPGFAHVALDHRGPVVVAPPLLGVARAPEEPGGLPRGVPPHRLDRREGRVLGVVQHFEARQPLRVRMRPPRTACPHVGLGAAGPRFPRHRCPSHRSRLRRFQPSGRGRGVPEGLAARDAAGQVFEEPEGREAALPPGPLPRVARPVHALRVPDRRVLPAEEEPGGARPQALGFPKSCAPPRARPGGASFFFPRPCSRLARARGGGDGGGLEVHVGLGLGAVLHVAELHPLGPVRVGAHAERVRVPPRHVRVHRLDLRGPPPLGQPLRAVHPAQAVEALAHHPRVAQAPVALPERGRAVEHQGGPFPKGEAVEDPEPLVQGLQVGRLSVPKGRAPRLHLLAPRRAAPRGARRGRAPVPGVV
mmetsp:Transcript_35056/g.79179  ORF Transcript_35056/g.79179 Transcript_35056/m.79179 type:complete len:414 (+) Transcript_35056:223-1464(+)